MVLDCAAPRGDNRRTLLLLLVLSVTQATVFNSDYVYNKIHPLLPEAPLDEEKAPDDMVTEVQDDFNNEGPQDWASSDMLDMVPGTKESSKNDLKQGIEAELNPVKSVLDRLNAASGFKPVGALAADRRKREASMFSSDSVFKEDLSVAKNPYAASNRAVEKPQEPLKPPMPVITPSRTDPQPEPPTVTRLARFFIHQAGGETEEEKRAREESQATDALSAQLNEIEASMKHNIPATHMLNQQAARWLLSAGAASPIDMDTLAALPDLVHGASKSSKGRLSVVKEDLLKMIQNAELEGMTPQHLEEELTRANARHAGLYALTHHGEAEQSAVGLERRVHEGIDAVLSVKSLEHKSDRDRMGNQIKSSMAPMIQLSAVLQTKVRTMDPSQAKRYCTLKWFTMLFGSNLRNPICKES